jgi:carboxymethylenebutenolidase
MQCTVENVEIAAAAGHVIRAWVVKPVAASPAKPLPAVLAYSDIFQLTGPQLRVCQRLAAYGFVVVSPEIFARLRLSQAGFDFERDRQLALDTTERMALAWFDEDRRAVLDWMAGQAFVDPDRLLACGWCIGGHLAFRAALEPDVKATACFYATGLHSDTLGGAHGTATSLASAKDVRGPLLLVWGTRDPHTPREGRVKIHRALDDAGTAYHVREYDAEHTFMRDEGARYDAVASDRAFADLLDLFAPFR